MFCFYRYKMYYYSCIKTLNISEYYQSAYQIKNIISIAYFEMYFNIFNINIIKNVHCLS